MKQQVTLALTLTLTAGLLAGCTNTTGGTQPTGAAQTSLADATTPNKAEVSASFTDEMKIPYAVDLSPEDGADSVERMGDHQDSPYFAYPDYYHMESTDTLTILTGFETMQQTSEWSCGVAAALIEEFCARAKAQGRRGVTLTCKKEKIEYYSRFGFRLLGVAASVHGGAVWYDMVFEF